MLSQSQQSRRLWILLGILLLVSIIACDEEIPAVVEIQTITISSNGEATTLEVGSTLQMHALVSPEDATNKAVSWSVEDGADDATIDANGLLTATQVGTITVVAAALDGSGVTGQMEIEIIENQELLDNRDINDAKSVIEGETFAVSQEAANSEEESRIAAEALVIELGERLNGTTIEVETKEFSAAEAGTVSTPNGTDGEYVFTVTISKGEGTTVATSELTMTIVADTYYPDQDNADIAAAKSAIEEETYTVSQDSAYTESEALIAAEALVDDLEGSLHNTVITIATMGFVSATEGTVDDLDGLDGTYSFTVTINKGAGVPVTTEVLTMTITATPYDTTQDNADILSAKQAIEETSYSATNEQAPNMEGAKATALALINELGEDLMYTTVEIPDGNFVSAVDGTASKPNGTDGTYKFSVTINKGAGEPVTTEELTMTISATPYSGPISNSVEGELTGDTAWSGIIEAGYVTIPSGVTLTIEPGTVVKFRASRDYKNVDKGGLGIEGGTLHAVGTADNPIIFTSDYESAGSDHAVNGDWFGISLFDTEASILDYTVVEFAEIGVEQFDSAVTVSHSVIRWNNTEGLYAERSTPVFEYNTLYQNGYHEIALEQDNTNVQIRNNLFRDGYVAIHAENTDVTIHDNYFDTYANHAITAGMDSTLTISDNIFHAISGDPNIMIPADSMATISNSIDDDGSHVPIFDYAIPDDYELGYRPAEQSYDEYQYVYDTTDETRVVTDKTGAGSELAFGWALEYSDGYLWRFSIGSGEHGEGLDFIRIDPDDGTSYVKMATNFAVNPRGLVRVGDYFFVNDFSNKKIYRFKPPGTIEEGNAVTDVSEFDIPDPSLGGTMGLAYDGTHLLLPSRDQDKLYKINPDDGTVSSEVILSHSVGNDITWHEGYIWSTASGVGLGKFEIDGNRANLIGSIYPVAYDAWAMTTNGESGDAFRLWTLQKTCELWDDDKLFEIQPLEMMSNN